MMKKIFTILFLFISLMVQAADKYIATAANGGSNSNSGTSGSPWLTLTYACAHTTSGDLITVGAGTFAEGTNKAIVPVGVSIVGQGVTSIISYTYSNSDTYAWHDAAMVLTSGSPTSTNGNQSISYLYFEGNSWTSTRAIAVNFRNNVEIHHCTFHNFYYSGATFNGSPNGYPTNTTLYHSTGNSFHDNAVYACSRSAVQWGGSSGGDYGHLIISGQDGFLTYNNIFDQTSLPSGYMADTWNGGLIKNCKYFNNTVTRNNDTGAWNFFSELMTIEGGLEVYGNTFTGNATLDIVDIRPGNSGFGGKFHDNTFINATQLPQNSHSVQCIDFEERGGIQYVYVYNNHFKNTDTPVQFDVHSDHVDKTLVGGNVTVDHCYIYYNLIEGLGQTTNNYSLGVALKPYGVLVDPVIFDNIYIDNNTIISGTTYHGYTGVSIETVSSMTNIYVRNNIIQNFGSNAIVYAYAFGTPSGSTHYIQDNIFYNNNSNTVRYSGITGINFTPSGGYISTSNPLFVSSGDFHLQSGSPAINAGVHITTPPITTDFDSVTIGNPPDIGAYEFVSNHPPSIQDQVFQLNENSPGGTSVGIVVATDPDAGQTLTYSIVSGNTDGSFAIDALTGVLSVVNGAALTVDFALLVKVQDNGVGELSNQATITINIIPTGIKFTEMNQVIKVYPNPVSDKLIIEVEGNKNNPGVEILNSIGQVVFEGNLSEKTIVQTSNFSPGIYLMKIENGRSFEFKKILKI
jgi:hypothetical protein